jgi:hypothetical protein
MIAHRLESTSSGAGDYAAAKPLYERALASDEAT